MKLSNNARQILTGQLRNKWVDRDPEQLCCRNILVKDIRCNLMLGWLKKVVPHSKIVLVIRHPLQVVSSWSRMGWRRGRPDKKRDIDIIIAQKQLLRDFPIINDLVKVVDLNDFIESIVFQWCLFHLVPLKQLNKAQRYTLLYENLILESEQEVTRLFEYLNKPFDTEVSSVLSKSSRTNFLGRNYREDKMLLVNGWKNEFSMNQVRKTHHILEAFGLGGLYDENGNPTGIEFSS